MSQPHMSKEEKIKQQTRQIFNISEKPILEYITDFLEEPASVIFKEDMPKESDPLILLPIPEYKEGVYLKFTLKTIDATDADNIDSHRITSINDIIHYKHVKESIGFLVYCIKSAYPSIIASSMINNKPMVHIDLELNESNWTFCPKFRHELTIKKKFLEDALSKIIYMKQQTDEPIPNEMAAEINKEYNNIIPALTQVNTDITPEILESEKKINISYRIKPVIGIFVTEINESQLPKYNNQQHKLPTISSQSYEDPK
jgi:hypothetical protein